jgi:hypothetical protein
VCGDRHEARKCAKVHALSVVIQALEFEPVGPQNQWVDAMFLTVGRRRRRKRGKVCAFGALCREVSCNSIVQMINGQLM